MYRGARWVFRFGIEKSILLPLCLRVSTVMLRRHIPVRGMTGGEGES